MKVIENPEPTLIPFKLKDASAACKNEVCGLIKVGPQGIGISFEGYGDMTSAAGYGQPVWIELWAGQLRVVAWANINREDPTHTIVMEGSRESRRAGSLQ